MITKEIVASYHEWLDNYIDSFIHDHPDLRENILIKADHSRRVSALIVKIAEDLQLNEKEILLAETIGLFHDIGRFKQYIKYQTFSDSKSQNHAELGVEVIEYENIFHDLSHEQKVIIESAVRNHSVACIPKNLSERELLFSKLIRDADKLDIWRLVVEYYYSSVPGDNRAIELELPNDPTVSPKVYDAIMNHQIVLKEDMQTLNDFKLLQVGWVFDLNFPYSYQHLKSKGYVDKILDTLSDTEEINNLKLEILKEIEKSV